MYALIIGIILIVLTTVTPFSSGYRALQHTAVRIADTVTQPVIPVVLSLFTLPQKVSELSHQVQVVEKENRRLAAQLTSCETAIDRQAQASLSAQPKDLRLHPATLSYFSNAWILLPFENTRPQVGDLILKDEIFVGTVISSTTSFATTEMIATKKTPMLVVHTASKITGLYRVEGDRPEVTFTTVVPSLKVGDEVTTVPDGKHTTRSFLVGKVQENLTSPSDSTSKVRISLATTPHVNDLVFVIGESR